jgi:hypothetical protein
MLLPGIDTSSTSYHVGQVVGLVILLLIGVLVVRSRLSPMVKVVVLLVLATVLVLDVNKFTSGKASQAWATTEGVNARAGFIAGCSQQDASRVSRCECVFERLSKVAPYDTPSAFATLDASIETYRQTRNVNALPPPLIAAIRTCAH